VKCWAAHPELLGGLADISAGLVTGDIILSESGGLSSDLLRFDSVTSGGTLFFYSDQDGG